MHDPDERVRRNLEENRRTWSENSYYDEAEAVMDEQWRRWVWPWIGGCDFTSVLELAPGHGRNSARLAEHARDLHLVDINASCIDYCRARFAQHPGPCRFHYHVNDGLGVPMIANDSVTLVYSWDAMVHFEPAVVRAYVREFARVLVRGGRGAVHFSNFGARAPDPNTTWGENPHGRSQMTRTLFAQYLAESGLVLVQDFVFDWEGHADIDCAALFAKP
jgi:ubiquinone/menaquinone biosynthesis C-methylase UbiE